MNDIIKPKHYLFYDFEVIDFLECVFLEMPKKELIFNIGNALKYALRSKHKCNELKDLKKCEYYIKRSLNHAGENYTVFLEKELDFYFKKISNKDFELFLLINDICSFALNPCSRNYNAVEKHIKRYISKRSEHEKEN